jgi:hypothetical protein
MTKSQLKAALSDVIGMTVEMTRRIDGHGPKHYPQYTSVDALVFARNEKIDALNGQIDEMYQGAADGESFDNEVPRCQHCDANLDGISFEHLQWHHYGACVNSALDAEFESSLIDMIEARHE